MAIDTLKITVYDGGKADGGVFGGSDDSGSEEGGKEKKEKSLLSKVLNYNQTIRGKLKQSVSATTFYAIQQGVSVVKQTARQFINYYVSDIGRSTGDSNYQAMVNRRMEVASDVMSIGAGMLSGAAAGVQFGGAVGAAVGAVVGAISSGINLGFKYADRERAYQHKLFQEYNSQAYQLARANYTAMTGRAR